MRVFTVKTNGNGKSRITKGRVNAEPYSIYALDYDGGEVDPSNVYTFHGIDEENGVEFYTLDDNYMDGIIEGTWTKVKLVVADD